MTAILVTGGAGYVGAHACKALSKAGYVPVTVDNLSTGHEHFVRWGPLIEADVGASDVIAQTIRRYEIEAVLHFAAKAYVGESVVDPQKYYENNVGGSLSLLSAILQSGCRKIVFSSSCAIYGEPDDMTIRETAPKQPVNPYGSSKLMTERILEDYARAYGLEFIALRYFNACGADPEAEIGERRDPETHLIPRAMMAIQGHITDFAVFGSDYPTPDGTAIRDYVHVTDLADAHVASLRRLLENGGGGVFNLGTGRGLSVKQVLNAITAGNGRTDRYEHEPSTPGRSADPHRGRLPCEVRTRLRAASIRPEDHRRNCLGLAPASTPEGAARGQLRSRLIAWNAATEAKISGEPLI